MSILCCRRSSSTSVHKPTIQIQPPKILRRLSIISISHNQTPQTIEAFYNEGRELFQARQEESEKSSLREAIHASCGEAMREHLGGDNPSDITEPRDFLAATRRADGRLFDNEGSQMLNNSHESAESHRILLPFKSASANELRLKALVNPSSRSIRGMLGSGKSMPILASVQSSEVVQKLSQLTLSGPEICPELLASLGRAPTDIHVSGLPVKTAASKTSTMSTITPIAMPPTPSLNPYLMPSIATTIASINEGLREAPPGVCDVFIANKESGYEGMDAGAPGNERKQTSDAGTSFGKPKIKSIFSSEYRVDRKDGTIIETERESLAVTNLLEKERGPSNDAAASDECFKPSEFFSNIPGWVKPSSSTFMSFPSSSPDPNQYEGPELPFRVGNTVLGPVDSTSSKSHSPSETPRAGSAGTSSPFLLHSLTPRYNFRQSIDNASSIYPSHETSRCQSLVGSIEAFPGPSHMPMWSASAVTRTLSRTPRPFDGVNSSASPGNSAFRFPWINRSANRSPEPIANQDAFIRRSSLAHLKQSQKRGWDLQRVPRVKPRDIPNYLQLEDHLIQNYSERYENIHLQKSSVARTMAGSLDYVQSNRKNWFIDDSHPGHFDNETIASPNGAASNNIDDFTWEGFPARTSSSPAPSEMATDAKNWRSPHGWKPGNPKGNTFSDYSKNRKIFSLRNSVSLGERMWGHDGKNREEYRRTMKTSGLTLDAESRDEGEERNYRRFNKRAMIRSRSMTLRRTFTSSIAKLRGKVSFSGTSKVTVASPSPIDRSGNKQRFYQIRHEWQRPRNYAPEGLNEKVEMELGDSESEISSAAFRPTLPKEMLEFGNSREFSKDTSPGNGDITHHSGPEPQLDSPLSLATTPAGRSAFSTASEGPRSRPWSTIYDDCVVFPFSAEDEAEGENEKNSLTDSELETPMSRLPGVREKRVRQVWRDAKESLEATN